MKKTISHSPLHILLILSIFITLAFSDRCSSNDKKTLLEIKKALKSPYITISWDPKIDCCEWNNVNCDEKTNRIVNLVLSDSNFNLPIPDAVGDLPYLKSLTFRQTNMTGQIPKAIAKLSELQSIDLRLNSLTGPIPSFLSQLKNLNYIGLSSNNFTGSIPSSLSKLPKLSGLLLDRNQLTGNIPESFSEFKVQDFYLYLSRNQLSGQIPRKLGYGNFSYIDASRNKLEGDISFLFGKNKSIGSLDFSRNMLQFDFSKVEIPENLTNIFLQHNKIFGSLPKGLAKHENLISLNVSYNRLCGKIPVGGGLQELDITRFYHNKCLCGSPLPKCK